MFSGEGSFARSAKTTQFVADWEGSRCSISQTLKIHKVVKSHDLEGDAVRKPLEERKKNLEESLYSNSPNAQEILKKLREVQQEEQSILSEIRKRDEEHSKLSADLEKQWKVDSRKSYTHRIKEITKNSRKQDADIERILKETREVQLF